MFKFLEKAKNEFLSHVDPSIQKLANIKLELDFYKTMYLNSYEQKFIEPYLSDEALIWKIENAIKNSKRLGIYELPKHYDEYLSTDGIAELLKRFKEKLNENR
jgi:hypothetical protein